MPYDTNAQLPAYVRALSAKRQNQWRSIWNQAYKNCLDKRQDGQQECESRAFRIASGVVKRGGKAKHSMPNPTQEELVNTLDVDDAELSDQWISDEAIAFKQLSSEQRKDLPKGAYAYTDSEGKGHLPIHDLPHLRNAVSRLGQNKTGKKWGLSDSSRQALQARLQKKLGRAQHAYDDKIAHHLVAFNVGVDPNGTPSEEIGQDDDTILRRGRIFRSGDYPDKDFSLSPKELKRVAKGFAGPIQLDSEHERSIFDGKLGKLVGVEASDDGSELFGTVAIPKWLDPILKQAGGKVSAAFDRATKKLVGLALTINPRVSDAALMAAFSIEQAAKGNLSVKELMRMAENDDKKSAKLEAKAAFDNDGDDDDDDDDDQKSANKAAKAKAKAKAKANKKAPKSDDDDDDADMSSKFVGYDGMVAKGQMESQSGSYNLADNKRGKGMTNSGAKIMQRIHDITATRGAVCRVEPQAATKIGPYGIVRYASKDEMNVIQSIHDTTLARGASCTPSLYGQQDTPDGLPWTWTYPGVNDEDRSGSLGAPKAPHFAGSKKGMSKDKAVKNLAKFMESLEDIDPRYGGTPAAAEDTSDKSRQRDEELEKLRIENRHMRMQGILDRAAAFADKVIQSGHAVPVEREGIVTVHAQLEHDDTFTAKATFSNGMSRVSAYEASILARPNNLLQAELLPTAVQQGLIRFANMTETPKAGASELPASMDRKKFLTNLDPVLKKAAGDVYTNGKAN